VFNSVGVKDKVKIIGVLADTNPIPEQNGNAPTVKSALGVDVPQQVNNYGLFVNKACQTKFPKEYAALSGSLKSALDDAEFKATVNQLGLTGWYTHTPAAQYDQEIIAEQPLLEKFVKDENLAPK
jgi:hypothetical protein